MKKTTAWILSGSTWQTQRANTPNSPRSHRWSRHKASRMETSTHKSGRNFSMILSASFQAWKSSYDDISQGGYGSGYPLCVNRNLLRNMVALCSSLQGSYRIFPSCNTRLQAWAVFVAIAAVLRWITGLSVIVILSQTRWNPDQTYVEYVFVPHFFPNI